MEGGSVRVWDWLAAISGIALIVGDFMPWYRTNLENYTAWSTLMLIDKLILITGLLALALPLVTALKATDKQSQKLVIALIVLGVLCVIFTIYRMTTMPVFTDPTIHKPVTLKAGAYVDLIAAIALTLSALLAFRARLARRARV